MPVHCDGVKHCGTLKLNGNVSNSCAVSWSSQLTKMTSIQVKSNWRSDVKN